MPSHVAPFWEEEEKRSTALPQRKSAPLAQRKSNPLMQRRSTYAMLVD